jgi:hypothetical protein
MREQEIELQLVRAVKQMGDRPKPRMTGSSKPAGVFGTDTKGAGRAGHNHNYAYRDFSGKKRAYRGF